MLTELALHHVYSTCCVDVFYEVFHELLDALHNARCDDSRVLLLTSSRNVFCSGVDLHYLLNECNDRRVAAKTMSDCLRLVRLIFIMSVFCNATSLTGCL